MVIPGLVELHQCPSLRLEVRLEMLLHPVCHRLVAMGSDVSSILHAVWPDTANASRVDAIGPITKIVNRSHQLEVTSQILA
jgi:hypothetical protein